MATAPLSVPSVEAQPAGGEAAVQSTAKTQERFVGVVTRSVAWIADIVLINIVAIMTGLGVALVTSVIHTSGKHRTTLEIIAGAVYVLWVCAYFVVFWTVTGQTPGARFMQIRLVTAKRARVKPIRAVVRLIGMELAAIPLFAGYLPVLFERRGLPDWLARTEVIESSQPSIVMARQAARRAAREGSRADPPRSRDGG